MEKKVEKIKYNFLAGQTFVAGPTFVQPEKSVKIFFKSYKSVIFMYRHFNPVMGERAKKRVHFGVHFSKKGKDQISVIEQVKRT
jgi:hypothetical protein